MSGTENGRDAIIGALRASLGARGDEPGRRGAVRARLERSPNGLIPERAGQDLAERIDQFTTSLKAQGAFVHELETLDQLPEAIAAQLAEFNMPARLRHGADPYLASLNWDGTMIERDTGPAEPEDTASLSRATTAAAETGTLVLTSGADNPSTLNFMPETHLVALFADDLCGSYEDAWDRLRGIYGRGELPRTVNFVSGPSATADIEQTLVRGAHGPKKLAVFLIVNRSGEVAAKKTNGSE
jgi:L-lactate dehydrogenase complex protein LldG